MSSGKPKQGDTRLVVAATTASALMEAKKADHGGSTSIVEYKPPVMLEDEEDLEVKLRRILENVPVRVSNTSGSSAGSGSGDFHQYRQMRRREQDRLTRMDIDYNKRLKMAEFTIRREEKLKAAEEKTSKKRLKRQKKKQKKQEKKIKPNTTTTEEQEKQPRADEEEEKSSDDGGDEEEEESLVEPLRPMFNIKFQENSS
ncbi:PRKR-interacting protein 1 [Capsella rubella]|nr:PRKR-interacting protein 1 [Capsella rubella]